MSEVETGDIGIFRPGDGHEALYAPGSIYAAVTLPDDVLEERAAEMELVLDRKQLGGSRISQRPLSPAHLAAFQEQFQRIHLGIGVRDASTLCRSLVECLIRTLARDPRPVAANRTAAAHRQVVARAKRFILDNLDQPLSIGAIARASFTSRSGLFRAFQDVLDDAPQSFIRKARLHRIRRDLATDQEARCTIALLVNKWGIGEPGRFAGWYRELFGELPSHTRAQHRSSPADDSSPSTLGRFA
jgi:AraC-like DNA-binding protein